MPLFSINCALTILLDFSSERDLFAEERRLYELQSQHDAKLDDVVQVNDSCCYWLLID